MSSELTPLAYVVLSLVGRQGAGAHDLVQMAASGQELYYAGAASKVYERAARLAQQGYLNAEKRPGKTRERTYYTLSDTGLAALQAWLEEPSRFPRIQSEAVTRVFASDLAVDEGAVVRSLQALESEIERLHRVLDDDERRAMQFPHRARQLRLVRSLGRRLLDAHTDWLAEVEDILGPAKPNRQRRHGDADDASDARAT
jgi:DNA-binding PadR family transcriptional regulator